MKQVFVVFRIFSIIACLALVRGLNGSTLTQVSDPSLGTQQAEPRPIAVAGNNTFFIANVGTIGNGGTGSIVGWFYDPATSTFSPGSSIA